MLPLLLALLPLPATLPEDVTAFVGPPATPTTPAGPGDVLVLDETGVAPSRIPAGLSGVELLAIDFAGRVEVNALRIDLPRLLGGGAIPPRIALPDGRGSIYHFRRAVGAGTTFGFFVVDGAGTARALLTRPGTGAAADEDPFVGRLAIDPAGGGFLVATSVPAGGDLLEVELSTGKITVRTPQLSPRAILPGGLRLAADWGLALTTKGPLRFERLPGARASFPGYARTLGPLPTLFENGVVLSDDGSTMAYVGAIANGQAFVQLVRRSGPVRPACVNPMPIPGAGFLPLSTTGPTLALAPDGSCVAWRTDADSNEAWVMPIPSSAGAPPPAPFQITASARFTDTLGETGVIGFLSPSVLSLVVGEPAGILTGGGIGSADVYRMDLLSGVITNVSATSGDTQVPFLTKGDLSTSDGLWNLTGSDQMLAVHGLGGSAELLSLSPGSGTSFVALDALKSLDTIDMLGSSVAMTARRDLLGRPTDVLLFDPAAGAPAMQLARLAKGCRFPSILPGPAGFAGVLECGASRWLGRLDLVTSTAELFGHQAQGFGLSLAPTSTGGVAGTILGSGGDLVFSWEPSGLARLLLSATGPVTLLP